jgi:hypothetical protein
MEYCVVGGGGAVSTALRAHVLLLLLCSQAGDEAHNVKTADVVSIIPRLSAVVINECGSMVE